MLAARKFSDEYVPLKAPNLVGYFHCFSNYLLKLWEKPAVSLFASLLRPVTHLQHDT
jgi:hypothetical protein